VKVRLGRGRQTIQLILSFFLTLTYEEAIGKWPPNQLQQRLFHSRQEKKEKKPHYYKKIFCEAFWNFSEAGSTFNRLS
jgi:hypothetical protein